MRSSDIHGAFDVTWNGGLDEVKALNRMMRGKRKCASCISIMIVVFGFGGGCGYYHRRLVENLRVSVNS